MVNFLTNLFKNKPIPVETEKDIVDTDNSVRMNDGWQPMNFEDAVGLLVSNDEELMEDLPGGGQ